MCGEYSMCGWSRGGESCVYAASPSTRLAELHTVVVVESVKWRVGQSLHTRSMHSPVYAAFVVQGT